MKKFFKSTWDFLKNTILVIAVFFFSMLIIQIELPVSTAKNLDGFEAFLLSASLTIIIIYVWKKIDNKFFK